MQQPRLIIHGGAWSIPHKYDEAHLNGIRNALNVGYPILDASGSALDAVEQAVRTLESDPTYDAGRGAFLNARGEIELDAIIVDGRTLDFGAVAAVQNILHPVSLARRIMSETEHVMLVGNGALDFAKQQGIEILDPKSLLTERELDFFEKIKNDPSFTTEIPFEQMPMDTVGAVAMDVHGNFAAATSTGGTARKLPGRVGDSPILGAGAYAENGFGAASSTGWGESIMRTMFAKRVLDEIAREGNSSGIHQAFDFLIAKTNGLAGIIGIDRDGQYFFHHNTPKMAFGYALGTNEFEIQIKV